MLERRMTGVALVLMALWCGPVEGQESVPRKVQEALAEVEVLVAVNRDFEAADERLDQAWQWVTGEGVFAEKDACQELVVLARARRWVAQGLAEQALAVLAEAPAQTPAVVAMIATLQDSEPPVAQDRLSDEDEAFLRLTFGPTNPRTDAYVRERWQNAQRKGVASLGLLAAPTLARLTLESIEPGVDEGEADPLLSLHYIDPQGARELIDRFHRSGGEDWRLRLLWMIQNLNPINSSNTWASGTDAAIAVCTQPVWVRVLAFLLRDPNPILRTRALAELGPVIDHNALSKELIEALVQIAKNHPMSHSLLVELMPDNDEVRVGGDQIWAALLGSPEPGVVSHAARFLAAYDSDALLPLAQHPESLVRVSVARSLGERQPWGPKYVRGRWGGTVPLSRIRPTWTDRHRSVMTQLVRDEAAQVRREALGVLRDLGEGANAAMLRPLVDDADPGVRQALIEGLVRGAFRFVRDDERAELLMAVCHSGRVEDLGHIDRELRKDQVRDDWDRITPVIVHRLFDRDSPIQQHSSGAVRKDLLEKALRPGPLGQELLFQCIQHDWMDGFRWCLMACPAEDLQAVAGRLAEDDWMRAFKWASADSLRYMVQDETLPPGSGQRTRLLRILADPAFTSRTRWNAATLLARAGGEEIQSAIHAALTGPDGVMAKGVFPLPEGEVNGFLLRVCQDDSILDRNLVRLLDLLDPRQPDATEACVVVTRRFLHDVEWRFHVLDALSHLETLPTGSFDPEVLAAALSLEWVQTPSHIGALVRHRPERTEDLLLKIMLDRAGSGDSAGKIVAAQTAAVRALVQIGGADAGESLLKALTYAYNEEVRQEIRDCLDVIQRLGRGAGHRATVRSEENTILELLDLLDGDDPVQRLAAVRALGAMHATAALPELIALLGSDEDALREAAQEALDRINAAGKGDE